MIFCSQSVYFCSALAQDAWAIIDDSSRDHDNVFTTRMGVTAVMFMGLMQMVKNSFVKHKGCSLQLRSPFQRCTLITKQ